MLFLDVPIFVSDFPINFSEGFLKFKLINDKEDLRSKLKKSKEQARECKAFIAAQETEERKLLRIIAEADAERIRQKKELDQVSDHLL
jgi:hypothetical protein